MTFRIYENINQGTVAAPSPPKGYYWRIMYVAAWIQEGSATGTRTISIELKTLSGPSYGYEVLLVPTLSSTLAVSGDILVAFGSGANSGLINASASESAQWNVLPVCTSDISLYVVYGLQSGDVSGLEFLAEEVSL